MARGRSGRVTPSGWEGCRSAPAGASRPGRARRPSLRGRLGGLRRSGLAVLVVAGAGTFAPLAGSLAGASSWGATGSVARGGRLVRIGVAARALPGERQAGALAAGRLLHLGVALRPRDPGGLARYATAVSTPGSASFHHYLSPAEFAARFGPTRAALASIEGLLRRDGLRVGTASANGLVVPVQGSAGRIEAAFHTRLADFRSVAGASAGWAAEQAPRLPAAVAGSVAGVLGLDNLATPHSMLERAPTLAQRAAAGRAVPVGLPAAGPLVPAPVPAAPGAHAVGTTGVPAGSSSPTRRPSVSTTHARTAAPVACGAATATARTGGGWTDQQVATSYGLKGLYAAGDVGAGQTIALYELEPFSMSDVAAFDRCYFGVSHTNLISTIPVDGFRLRGPGSGEALLDVEDVAALAPGARLLVYEGPNTTFGGIDAFNTIISQDRASIVSTSWGECEAALEVGAPQAQQIESTLFEEAAAQGQTVFAAAGDTGSDDCASTPFGSTTPAAPYLSVDDPASQPYVIGVGGTSLSAATNPPVQTAWNDGARWGAGGGGISATWPSPPWQAASGIPGIDPTARRQVPDVSATADEWRGITVYSASFAPGASGGVARPAAPARPAAQSVPGGWTTIGGTSSAAPTWAAVTAEIAASPACASLPAAAGSTRDLGFVGPELYSVAASPTGYAASFSDVQKGSNDVFGLGLGYRAGPGYDLATGLGSPIVTNAAGKGGLDASLCAAASGTAPGGRPRVTSLSPSSGPASGGTTVTIDGAGFPAGDPGAVQVSFGGAAATVVSVPSPTSLVVTTTPSSLALGAASFTAAGPVQVVVTVGHATSPPGPASTFDYVASPSATASPTPAGLAPPTVSGIGPSGVNVAGGARVTVYGDGFSAAVPPVVTFGGVRATGVRVLGTSELTAVVPPESAATACATGAGFTPATACQVEVVVSDAAGTSPAAPILPAISGPITFDRKGVVEPTTGTEVAPAATELDYAPTPVITSISPDPGDASGSSPVVIRGSGFNFNTLDWVNFGPASSAASEQVDIAAITPGEIVIDPPAAPSSVSTKTQPLPGGVSVQSAGGLSDVVPFDYAPVPSVRKLSVLGGPATGGTRLVLTGSGLAGASVVEFLSEVAGGAYGASGTVQVSGASASSLTVTTPADLPGPVDVLPCTPSGCARPDPARDTFVYFSPAGPRLAAMHPRSGPAQGGTQVTVFGENLNGAVAVRFGASGSSAITSSQDYPDGDPFILAVRSAAGPAGRTVPVTVVTRSGRSVPVAQGSFHYLPSAPSAPRGLRVALDASTAAVRWAAPLSDGGRPVTGYTALALAPGVAPVEVSLPATARSVSFPGLLARHGYEVRVAAVSSLGRGLWADAGPLTVAYASNGYWVATADGAVHGFGSLPGLGGVAGSTRSPVVAMAQSADGAGYWLLERDGTVASFGTAAVLGFPASTTPFVAIAAAPSGNGYWLLDRRGHVDAYGSARTYGSLSPAEASSPAVGLAPAPDGRGYWVLTANGSVTAFGSATAFPGESARWPGSPSVAIARRPSGPGYWVLAADGAVRGYGGAPVLGPPPASLSGRAVALAGAADGRGYWILTSTGAVYASGSARFEGRLSTPGSVPSVAIAAG